jgi:flagellar assembly protein FliH
MVDEMDKLFARLCRETGFSGRVIVLGESDIGAGEARMEWADGGVLIDQAGLEQSLHGVLAGMFSQNANPVTDAHLNEKAV